MRTMPSFFFGTFWLLFQVCVTPPQLLDYNLRQLMWACGGRIYVTVPDEDERANLSRQKPLSAIRLDYVGDKDRTHNRVRCLKPTFIPVFIIIIVTALVVFLPLVLKDEDATKTRGNGTVTCLDQCSITLVESIPDNLTYPEGSPVNPSIFYSWNRLLDLAQERLEIASFYWTMTGDDIGFQSPSDWQGEQILNRLIETGSTKGIDIRIVQNKPHTDNSTDIARLIQQHAATVRHIDFTRLFGGGVLHTKLWLVDRTHFFVGSANMDWRSLTQVKELGVLVENCPCLASDVGKLMDVYWYMGAPNSTVPAHWPSQYDTQINALNPLSVSFNGSAVNTFMASSPPPFCPDGRTTDLDAILSVIHAADRYINIAVMDYYPSVIYVRPKLFWPIIDDALRSAALDRGVRVRLLASKWRSTSPDMIAYLKSLQAINGTVAASIDVKLFITPAFTPEQKQIPYARVNHNKYMVTDKTAYIGTSNWSGDYFINTAGVSVALTPAPSTDGPAPSTDVRAQLEAVFERDWNSVYASSIYDF